MKLLLDAPEYLWRLIEKKRYLTATWLFLLSRSVYRSLEREEDKERWLSQGLDVLVCILVLVRTYESQTAPPGTIPSNPEAMGLHLPLPRSNRTQGYTIVSRPHNVIRG